MYDVETPGLMERKPRPKTVQIMTPRLAAQIIIWGAVMMVMTLIMLQYGIAVGGPAVGQSLALATFAFLHLFTALETRFPRATIFSQATFSSRTYNIILLVVLLNTFLAVELNLANMWFGTGQITSVQWAMCFLAALPLLVLWELLKFVQRRRIASGKVELSEW
jgi:Ca2+-transporting ATPase